MGLLSKKKFGSYIRKKRIELGLTQEEVAGRLGLSHYMVSKWERGILFPDFETLDMLAEILGVTMNDLHESAKVEKSTHLVVILCGIVTAGLLAAGVYTVSRNANKPVSGFRETTKVKEYSNNSENADDTVSDENAEIIYSADDILKNMDENQSHITAAISKNVKLDADITPANYYEKKLPVYKILPAEKISTKKDENKWREILNGIFGKDTVVSFDEIKDIAKYDESDLALYNFRYFPEYISYWSTPEYLTYLESIEAYFSIPVYDRNPDRKFLNECISKLPDTLFEGFNKEEYECAWINESYYKKTDELVYQNMYGGDSGEYFGYNIYDKKEEMFLLKFSCNKDSNIPFVHDKWLQYDFLNPYKEYPSLNIGSNELVLVITADGKLAAIAISNGFIYDKKITDVKPVGIDEILKKLETAFVHIGNNITITDIKLVYTDVIVQNKDDEIGCELSPVWHVTYRKSGSSTLFHQKLIYDAETGEELKSDKF